MLKPKLKGKHIKEMGKSLLNKAIGLSTYWQKLTSLWHSPWRWHLRPALIILVFLGSIIVPNLFVIEVAEAAIATRGTATTATTGIGSATTLVINKPSGVIAGDIMVATVSSSISNATMTISSGGSTPWTGLFSDGTTTTRTGNGSGHIYTQTFRRVVDTNDAGATNYTFTITVGSGANSNQRMAGVIMAYSGVNAVNPLFTSSATVYGTATTSNYPTASITPTANGAYIVGTFGSTYAPTVGSCTAMSPYNPGGADGVLGTEQGETCTQDTLNTNTTSELQHFAQTTAAAVRLGATIGSNTGRGAAHVLALRPATHTYTLSAYRWYININSIDFLGISHDAGLSQGCSNVTDKALSIVQHPTQSWAIMVGYDGCNSEQWQIQKRSTLDGTLIEEFGSNSTGIITHNGPAAGSDRATAIGRDNAGNIYIGGYETATSGALNEVNTRWRVEKRNWTNGQLVTDFGTGGVITSDPGTGSGKNDYLQGLYVDTTNGYLYAAGEDSFPTLNGTGWRVEKRNLTTGALCTNNVSCVIGGFGSSGVVSTNPSSNNDSPTTVSVDEGSGYLYVGGWYNSGDRGWRVEKRNAVTGNLCTTTAATDCPEGTFGFDGTNTNATGIYQHNPVANASSDDDISAVELEIKGGSKSLYIGGSDKPSGNTCSGGGGGNNQQWRMEKINAYTGGRLTAFNSTGIIQTNPDCNHDDVITSFSVDTVNDYVFIVGTDAGGGDAGGAAVDYKWRVEKRKSTTGALCTDNVVCNKTFGGTNNDAAGVATSNPVDGTCGTCGASANTDHDKPLDMIIDVPGDSLYIVGFDRGASADGTGDTQWRFEKRNLEDGTRQFAMGALADQDKPARPFRVNMQVRLRLLLHVDPASIYPTDSPPSFKLQYSPRIGTCDTSFVGEETSYADIVNNTGDLRWLDNSSAIDGDVPRDLGSADPIHTAHTNGIQTYEEANPFTVNSVITGGNDGLWDFALKDQESFGSFCVRAVRDNGTVPGELLTVSGGGYTHIPEINFCLYPPMDKLMRHGSYFCGQVENPFYWSLEDL